MFSTNVNLIVSLEFWGIICCLIVGVTLALQKKRDQIEKDIEVLVLISACVLLSDATAYYYNGIPGQSAWYITRISNLMLFVSNYCLLYQFSRYAYDVIRPMRKIHIWMFRSIWLMSLCSIILIVMSRCFPWFYYLDGNNVYQRLSGYPVVQVAPMLSCLFLLVIILQNPDRIYKNERRAMLIYLILPVLGTVVQIFVYGWPFQNIATTISCLSIYMARELDVRNKLKETSEVLNQQTQRLSQAVTAAQKATEEAVLANQAKGRFLSRMSHDIRTPLNGILGILTLIEKHLDDTEKISSDVGKARVAANHLLSLINDVLDMSKLEDENTQLVIEPLDLRELYHDVITICGIRATENGIHLTHDDAQQIMYPYVRGSALHIRQILMNIINNSVKYNKPNGSIDISVRMESYISNVVSYRFVIADTGIGMSEAFIEHLYEPFAQEHSDARSRYQGNGMGMAIVSTLVRRMNGRIDVSSQEGEGTVFEIVLPFEVASDTAIEKQPGIDEKISLKGLRVLLAEDNDLNMEIAQSILQDEGVQVTPAMNGLEAVRIFEDCPAGSFDVILMDIMMPGLDGYGAAIRIRQSQKADAQVIPIIAMTANVFADDVQKAKNAGMNDHLAKPLDMNDMMRKLSRYR